MDPKFSADPLPYSMNPRQDAIPVGLVQRETAEISTSIPESQYERTRRMITRQVLDWFWLDMGYICNSSVMQIYAGHPLRHLYETRARDNRERIARERAIDARRIARRTLGPEAA